MPTYGTYGVADLLAATNQSVIDFGEDKTFQAIQDTLDAHNTLLQGKLRELVETTTDRQRRYGGQDLMTMGAIDEFGNPDTQKVTAGSTVAFPLRKLGRSLQWTYTYFENATPAEMAAQVIAIQDADARAMDLAIRKAVFVPTNYTFTDRLVDNVDLPVKALVNADGAPLPVDPNGNTYDPTTRTHYVGSATLTSTVIDLVINNVLTFYQQGTPMLYINQAQEAGIRALNAAGQFTPAPLPGTIPGQNTNYAAGNVNGNLIFNRYLGVWGNSGTQVWVKPLVPPNYLFAWIQGGPKPLCMRIRNDRSGSLRMVYENELHPLRARSFEREYGIGIWQRAAASVAQVNNATYTAPVLT